MEQIIGKLEAKTLTSQKGPGLKIHNKWYDVQRNLLQTLNDLEKGELISIIVGDDNKTVIKIERLGLENNETTSSGGQQNYKQENKYSGSNYQSQQKQSYYQNNNNFIDFKKEELEFRHYQQDEILKQVCLKEAVNIVKSLIENTYLYNYTFSELDIEDEKEISKIILSEMRKEVEKEEDNIFNISSNEENNDNNMDDNEVNNNDSNGEVDNIVIDASEYISKRELREIIIEDISNDVLKIYEKFYNKLSSKNNNEKINNEGDQNEV